MKRAGWTIGPITGRMTGRITGWMMMGLWAALLGCGEARPGAGGGATVSDAGGTASQTGDASQGGGDAVTGGDVGPALADAGPTPPSKPEGLALLGGGHHNVNFVVLDEIAGPEAGLSVPRDAEINPDRPDELWTINTQNESVVIIFDPASDKPTFKKVWSPGSHHFMARPSALAFGAPGTMATIHETDEQTQGPNGTPPDFMGPTLHKTGTLLAFDAGYGSHLDMLHNAPNGMGIAWAQGNAYWVFDGLHSSLSLFDFETDHGPGGADHSSGTMARYVEGEVSRVPDVPSHLVFAPDSGLLYVADTGNNRIAVLDTVTGTKGATVFPNYDGVAQYRMDGATLTTLIDGADFDLSAPSGLELHEGLLWVTDSATGRVHAFDLDGEQIDWMDTWLEAGSLAGLAFDDSGHMYLTDALKSRVYRVSALPLSQD